jgi:CheY-like chemotaxis protein
VAVGETKPAMKSIPKKSRGASAHPAETAGVQSRLSPWKLLVVDDEPDIHQLTRTSLKGFRIGGRGLELLDAESAAQARVLLRRHPDIAVALVDVVMETEDAGLCLVQHIRQDLNLSMMRLLIRTGQPAVAPERYVIDNFDIDGAEIHVQAGIGAFAPEHAADPRIIERVLRSGGQHAGPGGGIPR